MHDDQNSRWRQRMRRIALNTQNIPLLADVDCSAMRLRWRTFFSRRLGTERVGFAWLQLAGRRREDGGVMRRERHQA